MRRLRQAHGFTIVELMIATAVFAVVLLLCATAIVQVGRMFYKGTIINRTQTAARTVAEDVSEAIQFGPNISNFFPAQVTKSYGTSPNNVTVKAYCVGDVRYSFAPANLALGAGTVSSGRIAHIFWKDRPGSSLTGSNCTPADLTSASPSSGGQELLGDSMRLSNFVITQGVSGSVWSVNIVVAYGATADLFTDTSYNACVAQKFGGQFCAVSTINTNVVKRL